VVFTGLSPKNKSFFTKQILNGGRCIRMLEKLLRPKWQSSSAHLFLLSRFTRPHMIKDFLKDDGWAIVLKEDPRKAIKRFSDEGLIQPSDLRGKLDHEYTLPKLKTLLKDKSLPVSGKKGDLIERLIEADPVGMESLVKGLEVFKCTEKGRTLSLDYLEKEKAKRELAEQKAFAALRKGDFKAAIDIATAYHTQEVFPSAGMVDISTIEGVFGNRPKILKDISDDNLNALRLASGMFCLFAGDVHKRWLPEDFRTESHLKPDAAMRMLCFYSSRLKEAARNRELGIKAVRVGMAGDSCENCRSLKDRKFKPEEAPEIPYEHCTNPNGCRCMVYPIF
jgi:hypothetical protein